MNSRYRDIPGYVILGAVFLLGLVLYGAVQLLDRPSKYEELTSYKNAADMAEEDATFHEEVLRQINEMGEYGDVYKKAEAGDAVAQYQIGNTYMYGTKGHEKNTDEALVWFRKSASQGNAAAEYQIGSLLHDFGQLLKAADDGDDWAQRFVGEIYLSYMKHPYDVKQDFAEAYFWLSLGAKENDQNTSFVADRDAAGAQLTAEQLSKIKQRLETWRKKHGNRDEK